MGLKTYIIGLPNVGTFNIFNSFIKATVLVKNYLFFIIVPNFGIVENHDERLNDIANIFNTKLITPYTVTFVDIAGLFHGFNRG